jgi:hypothetical protein
VLPVCLPPCCPALRSKFGNLFRKAADATAAQVKHDGFDLSVIEIKKEDLRKVYGPSSMHLNPLLFLPITRTVLHATHKHLLVARTTDNRSRACSIACL